MKKLILLLCALSIGIVSKAQNTNVYTRAPVNHNEEGGETAANSGFGIKGGVNFNQVMGSDKDQFSNFKNLTAWHAGFFAQFPLGKSEKSSLQIEALYNRQGYKAADSLKINLDYVQVPILYVYSINKHLGLHIGPYASILLSARKNDHEQGSEVKDNMNSFTWGAAGGVEARFSIVRFGARYNYSFSDIYKNPISFGNIEVSNLKTGNIQVYVGVGFK